MQKVDVLRAQVASTKEALQGRSSGEKPSIMSPYASPGSPAETRGFPLTFADKGRSAEEILTIYHQVFANVREGIAIQDAEGRIIEQNSAHRILLGYPDGELIGKTPAYYLEGGRDEFGRTMDDLLQRGHYFGEARCRAKSGRWVEAELGASIIRNEKDDILGYAFMVYDVTEKKRMEGALRESEDRFTIFMNNTSVIAFMRDVKCRYVYVNRAFEKYVGKPVAEILGKTVYEIWPPEIAASLDESDKWVLAAGRPMEVYEKTAHPGRETKEWLAIKFPFQDRKGSALVGCMSIDVTERKSLEEQLRQSQKMEAVGRLAGGIAHDFNNLLTIIAGYSELLLSSSTTEDGQRSKLEEVKKAGERAALLTRQLLAFSRKQVLAPCVLDLNGVIGNLRKMIERLIGEDIEFVTLPHDGLDRVKADPGQVEQIIMNLVVNARDAMPNGGRLTIETANIEFSQPSLRSHPPGLHGHYVMIAVSDTGTGMDSETQKHIFEPFFTTKETGKGTGLGLATVYGIIKQSGGFVWVYSELGVGTVFEIYFPRVLEQEKSPAAHRAETWPAKGTETILLAEDEPALRLLIRETLERSGYKVLEASDGNDAIKLSESYQQPIHLLISDVVMPQVSGRELAERVAAARPETKVLFISGYTDDTIIKHGVIDPKIAFLQKPFSPAAITNKVRSVLSKNAVSGP